MPPCDSQYHPADTKVEESISPLSLLIGLGTNLQQMALPAATDVKPLTSTQAQGMVRPEQMTQSAGRERFDDAAKRPAVELSSETSNFSNPAPLAGVGLKIERDVGGRGFRIAGVASDGPGEFFRLRLLCRPAPYWFSDLEICCS